MRKTVILVIVAVAMTATLALAAKPGFGTLFHDGDLVRTVVPPAKMKKPGVDDLYVIVEGVSGQRPVAAVAPGDKDYHGGKWAFHRVTWNVAPYLLTSEMEVHVAADAGDVSIAREPANDFKCPIQP